MEEKMKYNIEFLIWIMEYGIRIRSQMRVNSIKYREEYMNGVILKERFGVDHKN